jgi:hypothetical protein
MNQIGEEQINTGINTAETSNDSAEDQFTRVVNIEDLGQNDADENWVDK